MITLKEIKEKYPNLYTHIQEEIKRIKGECRKDINMGIISIFAWEQAILKHEFYSCLNKNKIEEADKIAVSKGYHNLFSPITIVEENKPYNDVTQDCISSNTVNYLPPGCTIEDDSGVLQWDEHRSAWKLVDISSFQPLAGHSRSVIMMIDRHTVKKEDFILFKALSYKEDIVPRERFKKLERKFKFN